MSLLDDGDARAAFGGQEGKFADQVPDRARLRVSRVADPNLPAGSFGGEPVQVGVIARGHQAAAPADAAGSRAGIRVAAEEAGGQVQRESRLADRARPDEQQGMRRPAEDHRFDLGQGAGLAARRGVVHGRRGGRAAARRLGAAGYSPAASPPSPIASAGCYGRGCRLATRRSSLLGRGRLGSRFAGFGRSPALARPLAPAAPPSAGLRRPRVAGLAFSAGASPSPVDSALRSASPASAGLRRPPRRARGLRRRRPRRLGRPGPRRRPGLAPPHRRPACSAWSRAGRAGAPRAPAEPRSTARPSRGHRRGALRRRDAAGAAGPRCGRSSRRRCGWA